jgi:hypothetical protein
MKKLKLKALELGAEELLQREQLKNVIGGSGSGDGSGGGCEVTCGSGYYACCNRNILVAYCNCKTNGSTNSCDAGGVGSTSCKIDMF